MVEQGELENVRLFRDIIKSSLGPNGLDKLLVNSHSGKILPSNASIYEHFFSTTYASSLYSDTRVPSHINPPPTTNNATNIPHNTANVSHNPQMATITTMVAMLLKAQQYMLNSCKDGSVSVVLLAASFLELGFKLHSEGISRNKISEIFQKGLLFSIAILDSMPKKDIIVNWSSMSQAQAMFRMLLDSKLALKESTSMSNLLAAATSTVSQSTEKRPKGTSFSVIDAIHLCTCIGGDITSSEQVPGIVIPYTPISIRRSIGTKTYIAIFGVPLQEHSKMSLVARFTSPLALKQWQNEEEQILKDMAIRIAQAGANIVISSGTIHKYILHWLDLHGIVVIQSVPKSDLIAISEATCAKIIYQTSLFDKLDLGKANSFDILSISGEDYSHINVPDAVSLLIRGPTRHKVNQLIKSCRDALTVVRTIKLTTDRSALQSTEVICGGGVPEMTIITQLPSYGHTDNYTEQYVLSTFASGFEIIPKCLLENSGAPNVTFQFLKEQHERGRTSMGIAKTGSIEEFNLDEPVAYDFVDVKKRIWSTAVDVAALLLVVNDSVVGNLLQ